MKMRQPSKLLRPSSLHLGDYCAGSVTLKGRTTEDYEGKSGEIEQKIAIRLCGCSDWRGVTLTSSSDHSQFGRKVDIVRME